MNWYAFLLGLLTGIAVVTTIKLLPDKLNMWKKGLIVTVTVAILALIVRLALKQVQ